MSLEAFREHLEWVRKSLPPASMEQFNVYKESLMILEQLYIAGHIEKVSLLEHARASAGLLQLWQRTFICGDEDLDECLEWYAPDVAVRYAAERRGDGKHMQKLGVEPEYAIVVLAEGILPVTLAGYEYELYEQRSREEIARIAEGERENSQHMA